MQHVRAHLLGFQAICEEVGDRVVGDGVPRARLRRRRRVGEQPLHGAGDRLRLLGLEATGRSAPPQRDAQVASKGEVQLGKAVLKRLGLRLRLLNEQSTLATQELSVLGAGHVEQCEGRAAVGRLRARAPHDLPKSRDERGWQQALLMPLGHDLLERGELAKARLAREVEQLAARGLHLLGRAATATGASAVEEDVLRSSQRRFLDGLLLAEDERQHARRPRALERVTLREDDGLNRPLHVGGSARVEEREHVREQPLAHELLEAQRMLDHLESALLARLRRLMRRRRLLDVRRRILVLVHGLVASRCLGSCILGCCHASRFGCDGLVGLGSIGLVARAGSDRHLLAKLVALCLELRDVEASAQVRVGVQQLAKQLQCLLAHVRRALIKQPLECLFGHLEVLLEREHRRGAEDRERRALRHLEVAERAQGVECSPAHGGDRVGRAIEQHLQQLGRRRLRTHLFCLGVRGAAHPQPRELHEQLAVRTHATGAQLICVRVEERLEELYVSREQQWRVACEGRQEARHVLSILGAGLVISELGVWQRRELLEHARHQPICTLVAELVKEMLHELGDVLDHRLLRALGDELHQPADDDVRLLVPQRWQSDQAPQGVSQRGSTHLMGARLLEDCECGRVKALNELLFGWPVVPQLLQTGCLAVCLRVGRDDGRDRRGL